MLREVTLKKSFMGTNVEESGIFVKVGILPIRGRNDGQIDKTALF